jgi:hypothetical protein
MSLNCRKTGPPTHRRCLDPSAPLWTLVSVAFALGAIALVWGKL